LPQRILINGGLAVLAGSVLYTIALIVRYVLADKRVLPPGLTLLALLITFSLGVMMLSFGIIGTYIFRVYQEVLSRPRYIIARSINVPEPAWDRTKALERVGANHGL
jgi:Na+/H+ antiporter NhaC